MYQADSLISGIYVVNSLAQWDLQPVEGHSFCGEAA